MVYSSSPYLGLSTTMSWYQGGIPAKNKFVILLVVWSAPVRSRKRNIDGHSNAFRRR